MSSGKQRAVKQGVETLRIMGRCEERTDTSEEEVSLCLCPSGTTETVSYFPFKTDGPVFLYAEFSL